MNLFSIWNSEHFSALLLCRKGQGLFSLPLPAKASLYQQPLPGHYEGSGCQTSSVTRVHRWEGLFLTESVSSLAVTQALHHAQGGLPLFSCPLPRLPSMEHNLSLASCLCPVCVGFLPRHQLTPFGISLSPLSLQVVPSQLLPPPRSPPLTPPNPLLQIPSAQTAPNIHLPGSQKIGGPALALL